MAAHEEDLLPSGDMTLADQLRWLDDLLSPETRLEVQMMNLSGRLKMPEKWSVRSQGLEEHLFYMVGKGGFEATIAGKKMKVLAGDLVWIVPGNPFSFQKTGSESLVVWRFRLKITKRDKTVTAPGAVCVISPAGNCLRWFEAIVDQTTAPEPWTEARLRGLLLSLSTEIFHARSAEAIGGSGELSRLQKAALIKLVETTPISRRPSVRELAHEVLLSPDYFARCFRRSFDCSPRRWLVEQRLRLAALRLLESDQRISEIADEFNYPDVFSFSKQFKNIMGSSPQNYRRARGTVAKLVH